VRWRSALSLRCAIGLWLSLEEGEILTHELRKGPTMTRQSSFPPVGFLILGVLSLAAAALFIIRAAVVEGTAERLWSAVVFGGFGVFWLVAYWSTHRHPTR